MGFALFLSGCVSSAPQKTPLIKYESPNTTNLSLTLRNEAEEWAGTPHELGGASKAGIDCSALVQTVFKDVLAVDLPRTTALQSQIGRVIDLKNVDVGDLIFYRIDAGTRHVGIYVGDDEFMHASKSEGVTISSLNEKYWQNRFWMVRRILDPTLDELTDEESKAAQQKKRSGW